MSSVHGRDSLSLYFLIFAQRKSKTKVKLNFGLSPDFTAQLKVSLSESLSERQVKS